MTSEVRINVSGIGEAIAKLKTLEYNARRRAVSAAVRAGNAVIVRAAKAAAPRRSGALAASIRGTTKLDRKTGTLIGSVTFKSTKSQKKKGLDAYYAHMVIGGTKPHDIPRVSKRRGQNGKAKRQYVVIDGHPYSRAKHPGQRPNPFMDHVADSSFSEVVHAFEARFAEAMDAEMAKVS